VFGVAIFNNTKYLPKSCEIEKPKVKQEVKPYKYESSAFILPEDHIVDMIQTRYDIPESLAENIVNLVYTYSKGDSFPRPITVLAIIATESGFKPNARSYLGATGLMQVMEKYHGPTPTIEDNIRKGIEILKEYRKLTKSDAEALEAYNVGITAILNGTKRNIKYVDRVMINKTKFRRVLI